LKIPNGIPLVYTMDENLNPILDFTDDLGFQANYLVSARNHGKVRMKWFHVSDDLVCMPDTSSSTTLFLKLQFHNLHFR
jgi:hypothetical protein